jgi:predicted AAA+ superfamily ATPase
MEELQVQVSAWETKRNSRAKSVDWQFTTDNARTKLKWLYSKL